MAGTAGNQQCFLSPTKITDENSCAHEQLCVFSQGVIGGSSGWLSAVIMIIIMMVDYSSSPKAGSPLLIIRSNLRRELSSLFTVSSHGCAV
jgi:hypothetical protein